MYSRASQSLLVFLKLKKLEGRRWEGAEVMAYKHVYKVGLLWKGPKLNLIFNQNNEKVFFKGEYYGQNMSNHNQMSKKSQFVLWWCHSVIQCKSIIGLGRL